MKSFLLIYLLFFVSGLCLAQENTVSGDTAFYDFVPEMGPGETTFHHHEWGSENITYLGLMDWKSPTGKDLKIKVVTTYQKITKANGFNDRSLLAIITSTNKLVKMYDMVKRQNLPNAIENNKLIFHSAKDDHIESELPRKFGERFCVTGLTCFNEYSED
ncbi:MAG: hypothetical protein MK078_11855 [Crocinitomicaceae bacterium]|nr:hypothetical protein [Crocinitomicaceae bacterium]